ncbi:hypothetical protein ACTWPT_27600 [Nonomuraea sp. 3N208]|uniref:hypothetical protein n=1 Tax=Nonomuraea sp. 3N208 TaxID=3457421 RepID=UPI003FD19C58
MIVPSVLIGCGENDPSNARPEDCLEALRQVLKTTGFHIVDGGAGKAACEAALRLDPFGSCESNTWFVTREAPVEKALRRFTTQARTSLLPGSAGFFEL